MARRDTRPVLARLARIAALHGARATTRSAQAQARLADLHAHHRDHRARLAREAQLATPEAAGHVAGFIRSMHARENQLLQAIEEARTEARAAQAAAQAAHEKATRSRGLHDRAQADHIRAQARAEARHLDETAIILWARHAGPHPES